MIACDVNAASLRLSDFRDRLSSQEVVMPTLLSQLGLKRGEMAPTVERASAIYIANPANYLCLYNYTPHDWVLHSNGLGAHFMENIWVYVEGCQLGYVQGISSWDGGRTIVIGHFAVAVDFMGTGVSHALIQELRTRLIQRLNTKVVRFEEQHSKFESMNYERFFRRIGAINLTREKSHHWVWHLRA
jgi:hypothetical protein